MTAAQTGGRKRWAWTKWPASFAVFVVALVAARNDMIEAGLGPLFYLGLIGLTGFYSVLGVVALVRMIHRGIRQWVAIRNKARDHDLAVRELDRWRESAGAATVRAETAEARLKTLDRDILREGRRRLLAELKATSLETMFRELQCGATEDELVIGALTVGRTPEVGSRYVLQTTSLREVKAALELIAIREDRTVIFRVKSASTEAYRTSLLSRAHSADSTLIGVEIVARDVEDLGEEPIWPEN